MITFLLLLIYVKTADHNIKWDHFDILASGKTDFYCKVKETLFIQELQPALNANVSVKSFYIFQDSLSIVSLYRQFPFEMSFKFLLQMFSF